MNILIVEDEPAIAQRLLRQIQEILKDAIGSILALDNLDDARDYIASHPIDLLMLDLNLHGEDGFELLQEMIAQSFHTIIVSANDDKAITAFEHGVLDFVAKPFTKERLSLALNRLGERRQQRDCATRYLSVKKAGGIHLIDITTLGYVRASGHYSELHCKSEQHLHDKAIEKLLAILPANFERVHRSYIVNLANVTRIISEPGSRYRLELNDGTLIPVSRNRATELKEKFSER